MTDAIDVHTHILPPGWEDFAARFGRDRHRWMVEGLAAGSVKGRVAATASDRSRIPSARQYSTTRFWPSVGTVRPEST